jgi:hypothetical protein
LKSCYLKTCPWFYFSLPTPSPTPSPSTGLHSATTAGSSASSGSSNAATNSKPPATNSKPQPVGDQEAEGYNVAQSNDYGPTGTSSTSNVPVAAEMKYRYQASWLTDYLVELCSDKNSMKCVQCGMIF